MVYWSLAPLRSQFCDAARRCWRRLTGGALVGDAATFGTAGAGGFALTGMDATLSGTGSAATGVDAAGAVPVAGKAKVAGADAGASGNGCGAGMGAATGVAVCADAITAGLLAADDVPETGPFGQ